MSIFTCIDIDFCSMSMQVKTEQKYLAVGGLIDMSFLEQFTIGIRVRVPCNRYRVA